MEQNTCRSIYDQGFGTTTINPPITLAGQTPSQATTLEPAPSTAVSGLTELGCYSITDMWQNSYTFNSEDMTPTMCDNQCTVSIIIIPL